ncbi:MAG TPA: FAD-binding oxidoreductase [Planctomycetota bacterium]|nr:FAD-binding oxidoreductase [Planctomycetota bacterium]
MRNDAAVASAVERLRDLLGPERVLTGPDIPALYSRDMLTPNRGFAAPLQGWPPPAVVRPDSTDAVANVLQAAGDYGFKLVCWVGGTNLMGSAASLEGEIILDLSRMNRVIKIDRTSRRAVVQPGVTLLKVEERAGVHGLMLGHDPWTRDYATVGGAISPDGLGFLAPRYGSMGQMVLGLTLVLPCGKVVEQRASERTPGFNALHLAVGQEGTLGVITEAVLRLRPLPEARKLQAFHFPEFASGFHAAIALRELGPSLLDFVESFEGQRLMPGGGGDLRPTIYLGFEGAKRVVEAQSREAGRIVRAFRGRRAGNGVAREYWDERHSIADMMARDASGRSDGDSFFRKLWFDYVHVSIPLGLVLEYRARALAILGRHDIQPSEVAIFAHPELMNIYFVKPRHEGGNGRADLENAVEELIHACHAMGGSMEYCHGVGTRLSRFLPAEMGAGLDVYDRIKFALDPRGVLPTLGRRSL